MIPDPEKIPVCLLTHSWPNIILPILERHVEKYSANIMATCRKYVFRGCCKRDSGGGRPWKVSFGMSDEDLIRKCFWRLCDADSPPVANLDAELAALSVVAAVQRCSGVTNRKASVNRYLVLASSHHYTFCCTLDKMCLYVLWEISSLPVHRAQAAQYRNKLNASPWECKIAWKASIVVSSSSEGKLHVLQHILYVWSLWSALQFRFMKVLWGGCDVNRIDLGMGVWLDLVYLKSDNRWSIIL